MKSRYVESDLDGARIYMFLFPFNFFLLSVHNEFVVHSKTLSPMLHGETVIKSDLCCM